MKLCIFTLLFSLVFSCRHAIQDDSQPLALIIKNSKISGYTYKKGGLLLSTTLNKGELHQLEVLVSDGLKTNSFNIENKDIHKTTSGYDLMVNADTTELLLKKYKRTLKVLIKTNQAKLPPRPITTPRIGDLCLESPDCEDDIE